DEATINKIVAANTGTAVQNFDLVSYIYQNPLRGIKIIVAGMSVLFLGYFLALNYNRRKQRKYFMRLAYVDTLTGLNNQNYMEANSEKLCHQAQKNRCAFAVFDVAGFKMINEAYGYEYGDEILQCIAHCFSQQLKEAEGEAFMRIDSDRFAALMHYNTVPELERRIEYEFDHVCSELAQNKIQDDKPVRFSCGIYLLTGQEQRITVAFDYADIARKALKNAGKRGICFFEEAMLIRLHRERDIESAMEKALAAGEFVPYFQPKVNMETGTTYGAEILVRWIRGADFTVYPDEFIPLFERNGFITKLDYYMFEQACICMRKWIDEGVFTGVVSVNISRIHLRNNTFVEGLALLADRYRIPHEMLELELTESAFFADRQQLINSMVKVKKAGFRIAVDDFGAGYSSLNILRQMPLDVLKIDKDFLEEGSGNDQRGNVIVSSVIEMAKRLDIDVICEGVETPDQADFLVKNGCVHGQGYLYARPMCAETFEAFVATETHSRQPQLTPTS
ncbi:MAG: bifunctional diguanylate cyclase/phosphodiesterase, partial [Oscillospiraceae bacterium]|nr:bifunctional diguanylate cyclase/phosphodiesterase [Oscillospiraceae bacterium]